MNTKYINRSEVKKLALELSKIRRAGKFTRVSGAFLERVNAQVRVTVESMVHSHPSVGKTLGA